MRFFAPVEVSEWCYLSEAILFVAFGRLPPADWYDERAQSLGEEPALVDARFTWREMPDNFEDLANSYAFDLFEQSDFATAEIEMPERYLEAASSILWGEVSDANIVIKFREYFERIKFEPPEQEGQLEMYQQALQTVEDSKELESLVKETNARFDPHLEKAWVRLFSGIHSGALRVEAVDLQRWEELADANEYEQAGQFVALPPEAFRIAHDFRQNELTFDGRKFVSTRVRFSELVTLVNGVFQSSEAVTARMYGQALVLENELLGATVPVGSRRPRGAPPALDWEKMESRLKEMRERGEVPGKKDACIQALVEYSESVLGRRVGRTTVQTRLRRSLDEIYARN